MAKANTTIDEGLYEGLQQAHKKKPRYYALIAKGAEVVGLIVQKKVINDGQVQKAKAECKGTLVVQGVCQGEGVELKFEVIDAEPSIAPKKIKDFIDEKTELALKPQWAIVKELSAVVDDANQPAASTTAAPAVTNQPSTAANQTAANTASGAVDARSLQARLQSLLERHNVVVGKNAALKWQLESFTKPAVELAMKGSPDASAALDRLEKALGAVERSQGQPTAAATQSDERECKQAIELARKYLGVLDKLHGFLPNGTPSIEGQNDERERKQAIELARKYLGVLDKLQGFLPDGSPSIEGQNDEREYKQAIELARKYLGVLDKLHVSLPDGSQSIEGQNVAT